jgi:sterol desaturase/sphingolipid hydroxylase (fatty acid hydroxylase superfamily)
MKTIYFVYLFIVSLMLIGLIFFPDCNVVYILLARVRNIIYQLFIYPGGLLSFFSLFVSFCVAIFFVLRRTQGKYLVSRKTLTKIFFPAWLTRHPSSSADVIMLIFNTGFIGLLFGWAIASEAGISRFGQHELIDTFGVIKPIKLSGFSVECIKTVTLFLAYEIGYYIDHYLKHHVKFLWEVHKVHHTAEKLSPLTNFRVHPLDTIIFFNILSIVIGLNDGLLNYLLGNEITEIQIFHKNILFICFFCIIGHLQHSQFWIPFTGAWGKIIISPAHHQIHHSKSPEHFNKNLGSFLAIWDLLFGTLAIPQRQNKNIVFGVNDTNDHAHNIHGLFFIPFYKSYAHLYKKIRMQ